MAARAGEIAPLPMRAVRARFSGLCSIRRSTANYWWMAARARRVGGTRGTSPIRRAIRGRFVRLRIPPKMPSSPVAEADYRIAAGKDAYRIEKRTGGKWSSIAAFAVSAATCKAAEVAPDAAAPKEPQ